MNSSCLTLDLALIHTNIAIIHVHPKCCTAGELVHRLEKVSGKYEVGCTKNEIGI